MSTSFFYCDQIPNRNSLREGRFPPLGSCVRVQSSWWEGTVEQSCSCHGSQEVEQSNTGRTEGALEHSQGLLRQLGPDCCLSRPLNVAIVLGVHQGINPSGRSRPSRCSHFPRTLQLVTKHPILEARRDISYSSHISIYEMRAIA